MTSKKIKKPSGEHHIPPPNALRKSAEQMLNTIGLVPQDPDEKEFKLVLQELQVHQIELEMQNDELRVLNLELDRQRKHFSAIYDDAPVGYFIVDHAGV